MPTPLADDLQVTYGDGTFATKEQMAQDVVNFLQWAAEPETEKLHPVAVPELEKSPEAIPVTISDIVSEYEIALTVFVGVV
jgi:hypothetical protein